MTQLIFLNGPPGCGKDYAGNVLATAPGVQLFKFATPLKNVVAEITGQTLSYLEEHKAAVNPFFNTTYRQLMIDVSERWMKPAYGQDIFARMLLLQMQAADFRRAVITDCGFAQEVEHIANYYGRANCLLLRVHRPNHTFKNDSRSYIAPEIPSLDLYNRGDETFKDCLLRLVEGFPCSS